MTAIYALLLLVLVVGLVAGALIAYLPRRKAVAVLTGLALWLLYVGALSYGGVLANQTRRPPGIVFIAAPLVLLIARAARSASAGAIAAALPIPVLAGLQTFRVGVELLLHRLWVDGLVPRLMTYEQGNWDILIGASAPVAAWLTTKGRSGRRAVLVWNLAGILLLGNIVLRAALTSPGPLHLLPAEVTNRAVGTFPFTYIAGFFAPLALVLHIFSLRRLWASRG